MLKMGQMCHCKCTLYRLDPSDGSIIWRYNRGVSETQLLVDGTDIYTFGANVSGKDDARIIKLADGGTAGPSVTWYANRNGKTAITYPNPAYHARNNREAICFSDTGYLWGIGTNGLASWDKATGAQQAFNATAPVLGGTSGGQGYGMVPGPGGVLYGCVDRTIRKFDTSCTELASRTFGIGVLRFTDICILGGGDIATCAYNISAPDATLLWRLNTSLVIQESSVGSPANFGGTLIRPFSTNDLLVIAEQTSGGSQRQLRRYSVNPFTEIWNKAIDTTGSVFSGNPLVVDGSDIYLLEGNKCVLRDSGGGVVWETTLPHETALTLAECDIKVGSDFVVVTSFGMNVADANTAICLEKSSGAIRWRANHVSLDVSCEIGPSDEVYIIGVVANLTSPL